LNHTGSFGVFYLELLVSIMDFFSQLGKLEHIQELEHFMWIMLDILVLLFCCRNCSFLSSPTCIWRHYSSIYYVLMILAFL